MRSTFVNTLPMNLLENKPGLIPAYFEVPQAPKGKFTTKFIDDGYALMVIPLSTGPAVKITVLGEKIAQSLVDDYINASLGTDMTPNDLGIRAVPGLFWLPGEVSEKEIEGRHAKKLERAIDETSRWFLNLVRLADDDWTKHHIHRSISDLQRKAAAYLGLEREWNVDPLALNQNRCFSCKTPFIQGAMICSQCNYILDTVAYEKHKSNFATVGVK